MKMKTSVVQNKFNYRFVMICGKKTIKHINKSERFPPFSDLQFSVPPPIPRSPFERQGSFNLFAVAEFLTFTMKNFRNKTKEISCFRDSPFSRFPVLKIPRFRNSPFSRFPVLEISPFRDSPCQRFPVLEIPRFRDSPFQRFIHLGMQQSFQKN